MRLYYSPGACSMAVHVVLEQLGAAFEPIAVPTNEGAQHRPEYRAVNPLARVPALVVGEVVLTEAAAILLYLESTHPGRGLMPADPLARAKLLSLMGFLASTLHIHYAMLWRPERFSDDATARERIKAFARPSLQASHAHLETLMPEQGWLGGEHLSLADAYLLPFMRWAWRVGLPLAQWPRQLRWAHRAFALPVVQRVQQREGIPAPELPA
jgi:glutathione S-transferase